RASHCSWGLTLSANPVLFTARIRLVRDVLAPTKSTNWVLGQTRSLSECSMRLPLLPFLPLQQQFATQNNAGTTCRCAVAQNLGQGIAKKFLAERVAKHSLSVTAYPSFAGEVEASNPPTIRRLTLSRRYPTFAHAPSRPSYVFLEGRIAVF